MTANLASEIKCCFLFCNLKKILPGNSATSSHFFHSSSGHCTFLKKYIRSFSQGYHFVLSCYRSPFICWKGIRSRNTMLTKELEGKEKKKRELQKRISHLGKINFNIWVLEERIILVEQGELWLHREAKIKPKKAEFVTVNIWGLYCTCWFGNGCFFPLPGCWSR